MQNLHDDFDMPPLSMAPKGTGRLTIDDLNKPVPEVANDPAAAKAPAAFAGDTIDVEFRPVSTDIEPPIATEPPIAAAAASFLTDEPVTQARHAEPARQKERATWPAAIVVAGLVGLGAFLYLGNDKQEAPALQVASVAPSVAAITSPVAARTTEESAKAITVETAVPAAAPASQPAPAAPVVSEVPAAKPTMAQVPTPADPVVETVSPAEAAILPTPEARKGRAEKVASKPREDIIARDTQRFREINAALGFELSKP